MSKLAFAMLLFLGLVGASACSQRETPPEPPAASFELPRPAVEMRADPAPPFTYWAPEGAVITNHPDVEGIWFADVNGRRVATYFGDQCRASELQRYIGSPLQSFPSSAPAGMELRLSCTTCAMNQDLRRNRINVLFDEATQRIERIECF